MIKGERADPDKRADKPTQLKASHSIGSPIEWLALVSNGSPARRTLVCWLEADRWPACFCVSGIGLPPQPVALQLFMCLSTPL